MNRGMSALSTTLSRHGVGYVVALTTMVTLAGAGATYAFERNVPNPSGIHDFGTALWWTAMIMTTMGSAYWPETHESCQTPSARASSRKPLPSISPPSTVKSRERLSPICRN